MKKTLAEMRIQDRAGVIAGTRADAWRGSAFRSLQLMVWWGISQVLRHRLEFYDERDVEFRAALLELSSCIVRVDDHGRSAYRLP